MKVTVNNIEIEIFDGAKVKDAVRAYYTKQNHHPPNEFPIVRDSYGHKVGADGSVLPDSILIIDYDKSNNKFQMIKKWLGNLFD